MRQRQHALQTITGIGAMLTIRDHALEIMGVTPDTPAAKAGLHRGLIIQQIDDTDIAGKSLAVCVAMTRGPVGSKVQLEVIDTAKNETNLVEMTREKIYICRDAVTANGWFFRGLNSFSPPDVFYLAATPAVSFILEP
jgi:C-terminal processing protease CtpA/Prc